MSVHLTGGWNTGTVILHRLSLSPEIIWVLVINTSFAKGDPLGGLSKVPNLAPEPGDLLGSKQEGPESSMCCE